LKLSKRRKRQAKEVTFFYGDEPSFNQCLTDIISCPGIESMARKTIDSSAHRAVTDWKVGLFAAAQAANGIILNPLRVAAHLESLRVAAHLKIMTRIACVCEELCTSL
jgi:hypothetical protein